MLDYGSCHTCQESIRLFRLLRVFYLFYVPYFFYLYFLKGQQGRINGSCRQIPGLSSVQNAHVYHLNHGRGIGASVLHICSYKNVPVLYQVCKSFLDAQHESA